MKDRTQGDPPSHVIPPHGGGARGGARQADAEGPAAAIDGHGATRSARGRGR